MKRLCHDNLSDVSAQVCIPTYPRETLQAGIVHLGIGAFHRAHQAAYTDRVLHQSPDNWLIIGCSLRSGQVRDQLSPQNGLYTLAECGPDAIRLRVIGAVQQVLVAPENPSALISAMAAATIRIISLTITEKGYCHDPATGELNVAHEDIQYDLKHLAAPRSAIAFIVAALILRRQRGFGGLSLMSCDNLPHNGKILQSVVLQFAAYIHFDLARWIAENCSFPATMIDRIVPATTDEDRANLARDIGVFDHGLVMAEPFSQWVIEDNFCRGRPAWDKAGALLVADVTPYENIKLRLLNGTHSLLAYTGYLAGITTISEVMQNDNFVQLARQFMDREAGQTLMVPATFDLTHYKHQLIQRFANPALKHRTWQIAMDGSQKIPQRWLVGLREQLAVDGSIAGYSLGLAAWFIYVGGIDGTGQSIEVLDPYAGKFALIWQQHGHNPKQLIVDMLSIDTIFGDDLVHSDRLRQEIHYWLMMIQQKGALTAVGEYCRVVDCETPTK